MASLKDQWANAEPIPLETEWEQAEPVKPPVIEPEGWRSKYGPAIRLASEIGGATVGGILGAPAALASGAGAPLVEAGAIGLGHLAGKTAADYVLAPPKDLTQVTLGTLSDIPESALIGMAGPVAGKVIGGAGGFLSRYGMTRTNLTPEMIGRLKLSSETGVPMTIADITGKKSHGIIESQLRRTAASADIAQEFRQTQYAALQDFANSIESRVFGGRGGITGELEAGQVAQKMAGARYKAFQRKAGILYDQAPVAPNERIETNFLKEVAGENAEALGKIDNATIKKILAIAQKDTTRIPTGIMDASGNPIVKRIPAYEWRELIQDQSMLRTLSRKAGDYNVRRIARQLVNAINDDVAAFAEKVGNPEVKTALDNAVSYYRNGDAKLPGIRVWRDPQIKNLVTTNSPEDIVKKFFKAYPNESDLARLKQVVGKRGFQELKKAWLNDLLTMGEAQSFSPARFSTAYDKYRAGGNLDIMLTDQERVGLDMLYDISKRVDFAERLAGNASGTGQINKNDLFRWYKHPILKTMEYVGAKTFANKYFTDPLFRMDVFNLLQRPPGIMSASGQAGVIGTSTIGTLTNKRP
jgi:hypothetical protein